MSEEQKNNVPLIGEIFVEGEAPPQYFQAFLNAQKKSEDAAAQSEAAANVAATAARDAAKSEQNAKADAGRAENAAKDLDGAFDDLSNEKRVPTRFEFEAGAINEAGALVNSSADVRTTDFHQLDCEYLIVEKENCAVYLMTYDNDGNFQSFGYSPAVETLANFRVYGKKYKIRITNYENGAIAAYTDIADVVAKAKFYKKNERFITEADINPIAFVKHDMAAGYKNAWINTDGTEYWSQACKLYQFSNTGFSKVKVFGYASNDVTAAIVFYSADGSILSLVPYRNTADGAWYEADVPVDCASFAITVVNNDTYPGKILLSVDGYYGNLKNLNDIFIEEDTAWED